MTEYLFIFLFMFFSDWLESHFKIFWYKKNTKVLERLRHDIKALPSQLTPTYGFVIPSYKNPNEVQKTVEHLANHTNIDRKQIIIVDDYSNDK